MLGGPSMPPGVGGDIAAAIPAAAPVDQGRFVLTVRDDGAGADDDDNRDTAPPTPSPSARSDKAYERAEQAAEQTLDGDWDRLLGPLPRRSSSNSNSSSGGDNADAVLNHHLEVDTRGDDKGDDPARRKRPKRGFCHCCPGVVRRGPWQSVVAAVGRDEATPSRRVGNMVVLCPPCFRAAGFGIIGPHWFGPVCCLGLLTIATIYFAPKAYHNVGPASASICVLFYIVGLVSLCIVSCSDPGVVKSGGGPNGYSGVPSDVSAGRGWRYCDLCSVYQPPSAVHCPECNICIEGYDHHCPWMGTCIGAKNYNSFLIFNMSWLFYILYAVIWVTFVGATFFAGPVMDSSGDE